jgi:hypothetical protein
MARVDYIVVGYFHPARERIASVLIRMTNGGDRKRGGKSDKIRQLSAKKYEKPLVHRKKDLSPGVTINSV